MSQEYPLHEFGELIEYDGQMVAVIIECPNCGELGAAWFRNTFGRKAEAEQPFQGRELWVRTGNSLDALSLVPSYLHKAHYHAIIREGKLCVTTPFLCRPGGKD